MYEHLCTRMIIFPVHSVETGNENTTGYEIHRSKRSRKCKWLHHIPDGRKHRQQQYRT